MGIHEVAQRTDEAVDLRLAVGVADERHDPAVVDLLHVDVALLAQPVERGVAGETDNAAIV
jgi:hypothetical protein